MKHYANMIICICGIECKPESNIALSTLGPAKYLQGFRDKSMKYKLSSTPFKTRLCVVDSSPRIRKLKNKSGIGFALFSFLLVFKTIYLFQNSIYQWRHWSKVWKTQNFIKIIYVHIHTLLLCTTWNNKVHSSKLAVRLSKDLYMKFLKPPFSIHNLIK